MTSSTNSGVTGSMYVRSAISGSVMIVAGFEFTRMTSYPSSRSALRGLRPGIVELGGLPDDDRARSR